MNEVTFQYQLVLQAVVVGQNAYHIECRLTGAKFELVYFRFGSKPADPMA